jgi:nicotinamidase-related amidase
MVETPSRFDPTTSAVIVIDVQNDFCDPQGLLAKAGSDTTDVEAMVPRLNRFLSLARESGVRVVFVRTTHDETTDSAVWLACKPSRSAPGMRPVSSCRPGSWGAEFYVVAPQEGDPVILKHRYSAFTGTNLDLTLRALGITSLFFTGVATEVCVESSLRDGLFHDYHVTLVHDCCATYDRESHSATLNAVRKYFGVVASADEVVGHWTANANAVQLVHASSPAR